MFRPINNRVLHALCAVVGPTLRRRALLLSTAPYQPQGDPAVLFPGTYYLTGIDDKHRRQYSRAT